MNSLFDWTPPSLDFDGKTYEAAFDENRLGRQLRAVYGAMKDGMWRTLEELESATHCPQASVSARLRDLRKEKFGGFVVERRSRGERARGLFEYRLTRAANRDQEESQ